MPRKKSKPHDEFATGIARYLPDAKDESTEDVSKDEASVEDVHTDAPITTKDNVGSGTAKEYRENDYDSSVPEVTATPKEEGKFRASGGQEERADEVDVSEGVEERVRLTGPFVGISTSQLFEQTWLAIRRISGERVTQATIIEAALRVSCRDFEEGGAGSALFQEVLRLRGGE